MSASQLVSIRKLQNRERFGRTRKQQNASRYLLAFEHGYARQSLRRRELVAAMHHEGSNEGRGQVTDASLGINATEVRYSERVRVSRNDGYLTANGSIVATEEASYGEWAKDVDRSYPLRKDATVNGQPAGGDCFSVTVPLWLLEGFGAAVAFDMNRNDATVIQAPEKDARTPHKATRTEATADHAGAYASLLAAVGAIGNTD